MNKYSGGDTVYAMGVIGALVYYIQHVNTLNEFIIGVVKALFWPAFLVFKLLAHYGI
jgi:hypothetical protein